MIDGRVDYHTPRARWAAFERQLYEGAISDVSRYQGILGTVRRLADELRHIEALEQLEAAWPGDSTLAITLEALPFPKEQLLGAAFAIREREICELDARRIRRSRIDKARGSGHAWVTLEGSGELDRGAAAPFQGIEMHIETGLAIISMLQRNPLDGATVFVTALARFDPESGEVIEIAPGVDDWKEHEAVGPALESRDALRDRIEYTQKMKIETALVALDR
ncbi:hypothetical protein [Methylocystis sp. Sn-Cys]|uniref:hypothetical protein n=1 Tax=Methylocystis sp. Sn-Cys TaxID=1701263 RepID=UPI0019240136|nr:hypothetical protein [Methylocystis sp. Sn-Cys]MBL1257808.1 hypothetical protein [Methylocystis sp. Sn-Cys]